MASMYNRLLDPSTVLGPNKASERDQVVDAGAYSRLDIQIRLLNPGTDGELQIQHSATNEEATWLDLLTPPGFDLTQNAKCYYLTADSFLRYIRWCTNGAVAGSPVVLIDVIAKE